MSDGESAEPYSFLLLGQHICKSVKTIIVIKQCKGLAAMSGGNKGKLALAAKALVEAASLEVDSMTQKKLADSLVALQTSFETSMNAMAKSQDDASKKSDKMMGMMNTVNQNLSTLIKRTEETNKLLQSQAKASTIQAAFGRTSYQAFTYYDDRATKKSENLVEDILATFLAGSGLSLPLDASLRGYSHYSSEQEKETGRKEFRAKLENQLRYLLGHKPRFRDDGNGKYSIWYE